MAISLLASNSGNVMSKSPPKSSEIELRPDGWNRFVSAVHAAAKHGPMHRTAKPKRRPKATPKPKKTA
jgi:hypothetical protein